jgi:hypothetical protein
MGVVHEDIDRGRVERTVADARTAIKLTGVAKE